MRHDLLLLALTAALAGCTPGGVDTDTGEDTEDTDTGVDTDTSVDTDTDTSVDPFCGDGHVDVGEQCDLGDANGAAGECGDACTWNGWVTCDMLAGPFVTLNTSVAQPDGSFHVNGQFDGLVALDSSCVSDVTQSVAVKFTLPAAGAYRVSTDNATDTANTAISLRTDCDDRAEISCGVDNAPAAGASQAFIVDGAAGSSWVALVELVGGTSNGWHLSLTPIDGIAEVGETCDRDTPCNDGATCTDAGAFSLCVAETTPVVTSATVEQVATYSYKISVNGTDANHDVTTAFVPAFEDDYGDLWGDSANEQPISIPSTRVTWAGDTFTASWVQHVSFIGTGLGDIVNLDVQVADRTGQLSNTVNVVFPTAVSSTALPYIGDACDVDGFPTYCNNASHADPANPSVSIPALVCTWNETNTATTCQDRNINPPPVMDGGEMYWQGTTAWLSLSGYDTVELISPGSSQGFSAILEAVYTDGTKVSLGSRFLSVCTFDRGDFTCDGSLVTTAITKPVAHLSVLVRDQGNPAATTVTPLIIPWVEYAPPTVVGYYEECDLHGWETTCEEPYVCGPSLSGIPACSESLPPVLYGVSGTFTYVNQNNVSMKFAVDAEDPNADWSALMVERVGGNPSPMGTYANDFRWTPDPFGEQAWQGTTTANFATWLYRVWLKDADGNVSDAEIVSGLPTLAEGDVCATAGSCPPGPGFCNAPPPTAYCDVEAGDTCSNRVDLAGTVKVCEDAVAPVLDTVTVQRLDSKRYKVLWTGSDANGDAVEVQVVKYENGVPRQLDSTVDTATPMFGNTTFSSTFTASATTNNNGPGIIDPYADVELEVTLQDWAFLTSNTIRVTVPPALRPGDECTGDPAIGTCWEASECISGECFAYEPQVSTAALSYKAGTNGREMELTVTGYDDKTGGNHTLARMYVTIAGYTTEVTSIAKTGTTAPTWVGNQFTYKITLLKAGTLNYQLGTGYLVDALPFTVRVVDIGGFEDSATFFVTPPHKGLGDACDPTGVANTCHTGLVCDGVELECVNDPDPLKVCGGVPVIEATSDVVAYDIPATGGTLPATPNLELYKDFASCGATNSPTGTERVIRYTAAETGTLRITSASTDTLKQPGYLFARVNECVNYDAIVDCSNLTPNGTTILANDVEVPVVAGDVVYVTVDGPSHLKGAGTVTFEYLAE